MTISDEFSTESTNRFFSYGNKLDLSYNYKQLLALLRPELLTLRTSLTVKGEMAKMATDAPPGIGYSYLYGVNGSAFSKAGVPITFTTSSTTQEVMPLTSAGYTVNTRTIGAGFSLIGGSLCTSEGKMKRRAEVAARETQRRQMQENQLRSLIPEVSAEFTATDLYAPPYGGDGVRAGRYNDPPSYGPEVLVPILLESSVEVGEGPDSLSRIVCGSSANFGVEQTKQSMAGAATQYAATTTVYSGDIASRYKGNDLNIVGSYTMQGSDSRVGSQSVKRSDRGLVFNLKDRFENDRKSIRLDTSMRYRDATNGGIPLQSVGLNETYSHLVNPNLSLVASYGLDWTGTKGADGEEQETTAHSFDLQGQLSSGAFTSRLGGRCLLSDFLGGDETRCAILTGLGYQKRLSEGNNLSLNVSLSHERDERHARASDLVVRDELHQNVHQGDTLIINNYRTVAAVTKIMSKAPDVIYAEGVDYRLDLSIGRIDIIPLGRIDSSMSGAGMDIYIDYTVRVDPSATFSTDTATVSTGLSLLDNMLTVNGTYTASIQNLVAGESAEAVGLYNSHLATVIAQLNLRQQVVNLNYQYNLIGATEFQSVEGGWQLRPKVEGSQPRWELQVKDRYTVNSPVTTAASAIPGNTDNTITASVGHIRNLTQNVASTLEVSIVDDVRASGGATGTTTREDMVSVSAGIKAQWRRLSVEVAGKTTWLIHSEHGTPNSRNDYIRIAITRSF